MIQTQAEEAKSFEHPAMGWATSGSLCEVAGVPLLGARTRSCREMFIGFLGVKTSLSPSVLPNETDRRLMGQRNLNCRTEVEREFLAK